tara:strand:- start:144 stop:362 length:219 start_codon:yes stop_codon:yes gene_type:complete
MKLKDNLLFILEFTHEGLTTAILTSSSYTLIKSPPIAEDLEEKDKFEKSKILFCGKAKKTKKIKKYVSVNLI